MTAQLCVYHVFRGRSQLMFGGDWRCAHVLTCTLESNIGRRGTFQSFANELNIITKFETLTARSVVRLEIYGRTCCNTRRGMTNDGDNSSLRSKTQLIVLTGSQ